MIAPHPDDETLGVGGTIALHIKNNHEILVVFVTTGEMCYHVKGFYDVPLENVKKIRINEAYKALSVLGVKRDQLIFLDLGDTKVSEKIKTLSNLLAEIIKKYKPDVIYCPHETDKHKDHRASCLALKKAIEACKGLNKEILVRYYVIWGSILGEKKCIRIDKGLKSEALKHYRSQIELLGRDFFERFIKDYECFLEETIKL